MSDTKRVAEVSTSVHVIYADGTIDTHENSCTINGDKALNRTRAEQLGQNVYNTVLSVVSADEDID